MYGVASSKMVYYSHRKANHPELINRRYNMSTLGENIANLRKNKGMTQEKLAETIGISAQSVSKWENNVSMPDIALLPILSDIFSVTIDTLFGIGSNTPVSAEKITSTVMDTIYTSIASTFGAAKGSDKFEEYVSNVNAKNGISTAVFTENNGAVWANEDIAVVFRNNPDEFAKNLSTLSEDASEVLKALANHDVCTVLSIMLVHPISYSIAYLSKKCALSTEAVTTALETLRSIGLVRETKEAFEDETISIWHPLSTHKMLFVYSIFVLAGKITDDDNYYCYRGDAKWCF